MDKADEWLLYDMHSSRTHNGRGIMTGRIYTRDGQLVATTAQECLIRLSEIDLQKRRKRKEESSKI